MTAKTLIFGFPAAVCILLSLFVGAAMGQWLANPVNPDAQRAVASLTKVDYILITHGHRDHVGDAAADQQVVLHLATGVGPLREREAGHCRRAGEPCE